MFENVTCIELASSGTDSLTILDKFVDFVMSFFAFDNVVYIVFPLLLFVFGALVHFVKRMAKGVF